jgi:uncharacterized protein YxjI
MAQSETHGITALDFTDTEYTVEQSFVRNKYKAVNSDEETVLKGKQKLFKAKEEFPFIDGDGNEAFTVKASRIIDIAADYSLIDSQTGDEIAILDNDFSIFQDTWKIRDPNDQSMIAEINSRGALVTLAREKLPFGQWIPHKYEITDASGNHVGSIDGQFSFRDQFDISIDDASTVPKETVLAAAMVIDAIQNR